MTETLKRLQEQRAAATKAVNEIVERAANGKGGAEDEEAFTKASAEEKRYGDLIKAETGRMQDEDDIRHAIQVAEQRAAAGLVQKRDNAAPGKDIRSLIAADLERSKDGTRVDGGVFQRLGPSDAEQRLLAAGTATKGPETIPTTLARTLYEKLFDDSAILQAGPEILRTDSGEAIKFPRLTGLGALSMANARRGENTQIQAGDPTFDQVTLDAYKYAQITQLTRELIDDSVLDMEALAGRILARNMSNYLGYDLLLGSGTSQPRGIHTATAATAGQLVTSGTGVAGAIANVDQLFDVTAKLKPAARRRGVWVMNDATMFTLRKFKMNGEANNYVFAPGIDGPDTLLNRPVVIDPNMPNAAVNVTSILFFDPSAFYVRLVNNLRVEWSTEFAWDYDLVSVKAVLRADADVVDDTLIAGFKGAAT